MININNKIFYKRLDKFLNLYKLKYNYIDVGSSLPLNKFTKYIENHFSMHLFEPNASEAEKLQKKLSLQKNYFINSTAIGSNKKLNINIYNNKNLSSALKLNTIYNSFHPKYKLIKKINSKSSGLNKYISNNKNVIKIDAQGYSYQCIQSAKKKLKNVPVIIAELEKYELYKKQYLVHDVSKLLYKQDYILIGNLCDYNKSLLKQNRKKNLYFKEITYAQDLIFIKNIFEKKLDTDSYILIIIFLTIFNFCDLAYYILDKKSYLKNDIKLNLRKLIDSKIIDNKSLIKKLYNDLLNKKINLKEFLESSSWSNENSAQL